MNNVNATTTAPRIGMDQIKFEETLKEGDRVEVRWTNSYRYYVALARVVRVNGSSVRVTVTDAHPKRPDGGYLIGRTLAFPRFFAAKWSENNGVFPCEEG